MINIHGSELSRDGVDIIAIKDRAYHQFERIVYHQTKADITIHGIAVMIYKGEIAFGDIQALGA